MTAIFRFSSEKLRESTKLTQPAEPGSNPDFLIPEPASLSFLFFNIAEPILMTRPLVNIFVS